MQMIIIHKNANYVLWTLMDFCPVDIDQFGQFYSIYNLFQIFLMPIYFHLPFGFSFEVFVTSYRFLN